ncbi:hypothetical protein AB9K41_22230, partial [Cribrihabitans sp. XS_ASV171]
MQKHHVNGDETRGFPCKLLNFRNITDCAYAENRRCGRSGIVLIRAGKELMQETFPMKTGAKLPEVTFHTRV